MGLAGPASAHTGPAPAPTSPAATPIEHLVVLFQENVSFDHYFGTYPNAANTDGTPFQAAPGTPSVNGLTGALLTANPNLTNPQRLAHSEALTCDQDHNYQAEQQAFDRGLMDQFVQYTNRESDGKPLTRGECVTGSTTGATPDDYAVMDYYDGNTVTALWNYAQHFAMSDNSYGTTFGPSTPGALNLISGQTAGAYAVTPAGERTTDDYAVPNQDGIQGTGTVINDPDGAFDSCSNPKYNRAALTGTNVGDLLNEKEVSWGWFQGGFADCSAASEVGKYAEQHPTDAETGKPETTQDYSAHHEPFQYYESTANPEHTPPASVDEIGHDGQANHQYDLTNFDQALDNGTLPAVSYLKAKKSEDGHAGYSDPLDEQHFIVDTINKLQQSKDWKSTAVVIAYDDSDGWYDHQMSPILNHSQSEEDALSADGECGSGGPTLGGEQLRCGYGPRVPLLVVSPYSKVNAVDSTVTDQTSILRFVEDNWLGGQRIDSSFDALAGPLDGMLDFSKPAAKPLFLDPVTGGVSSRHAQKHGHGDEHGNGDDKGHGES
ncbi:phospholipase C [Modestobacter sp. DSM 44400]|uniref:phospholipase C n=1 Tax=Modestobacter sp. DSM 44400 TaxID=1550230 RepID=UPI001C31B96C|nr:alkaline phosphatase family protein [Modestobacter sp. DSM 44400]